MKQKWSPWLAWIAFGLITASILISLVFKLTHDPNLNITYDMLGEVLFNLVVISFPLVGALIISYQPQNMIGWLLMLPGLAFANPAEGYISQFAVAPAVTPLLLIALWFANWSWLLLVMPILFIMLLFPRGRSLSPRWRWLIYFGLGLCLYLILIGTFAQELGPMNAEWTVPNPIGFISLHTIDTYFITPWIIILPLYTLLCAASLFLRFRRARPVEREQIKWLFYACGFFAVTYIPSFFVEIWLSNTISIWDILFLLGIMIVPISIAVSILRYHLWDIDVIIRRTLLYGVLTILLAIVYFGLVVLLQQVFGAITNSENSPIAIVISTLVIAALFNPLRLRLQSVVDRRFYRRKYNAEQALAQFADVARNETDIEHLNTELTKLVAETMQPEKLSMWLKPARDHEL